MTADELRDHAHEMLTAMVEDLGAAQSATEESQKSKGLGLTRAMQASGELHADARITHRFDAKQVVAEFRALRASVLRLYAADGGEADLHGVQRFNEAVDEVLTASIERYSDRVGAYETSSSGCSATTSARP